MVEQKLYFTKKNIVDDLFDVEHLHDYTLAILASDKGLRFSVIDIKHNKFLAIEDFVYNFQNSHFSYPLAIDQIFDEHSYLKAGFWKSIKLFVRNAKFTILPVSLFDEKLKKEALSLNCNISSSENINFYKHSSTDIVNIFAYEKEIFDTIQKIYPNKLIELVHHSSMFFEGVLSHSNNHQHVNVFAYVEDNLLTIAVKKEEKILFINNFKFQSANDLLYFVLFVYEEIDLNPEIVPLNLSGDIDKASEGFDKLHRFIRYIKFTSKPQNLKLSYKFDEVDDHRYFSLLNAHLC